MSTTTTTPRISETEDDSITQNITVRVPSSPAAGATQRITAAIGVDVTPRIGESLPAPVYPGEFFRQLENGEPRVLENGALRLLEM